MRPTNGWYYGNSVDWDGMGEPEFPDYGAYCPHCGKELTRTFQKRCGTCQEEIDWRDVSVFYGETRLYGDWKRKGKVWSPDRSGDFAAAYNSNTNDICVHWSKIVRYGHAGSPCIPGQVYANEDDPNSTDGLNVIELEPGKMWPPQWAGGFQEYYHPYYALPDYCLRGREDE